MVSKCNCLSFFIKLLNIDDVDALWIGHMNRSYHMQQYQSNYKPVNMFYVSYVQYTALLAFKRLFCAW